MSVAALVVGLLCLGAILLLLVLAAALWLQNRQQERENQPLPADRDTPPLGLEADEDLYQTVEGLLLQGRKIEAIKLYREMTGVGLKEAKDTIDKMDREAQ